MGQHQGETEFQASLGYIAKPPGNFHLLEWRDGPTVKSTGQSCRGAWFGSQHPYEGLRPPLTPVPGDLDALF